MQPLKMESAPVTEHYLLAAARAAAIPQSVQLQRLREATGGTVADAHWLSPGLRFDISFALPSDLERDWTSVPGPQRVRLVGRAITLRVVRPRAVLHRLQTLLWSLGLREDPSQEYLTALEPLAASAAPAATGDAGAAAPAPCYRLRGRVEAVRSPAGRQEPAQPGDTAAGAIRGGRAPGPLHFLVCGADGLWRLDVVARSAPPALRPGAWVEAVCALEGQLLPPDATIDVASAATENAGESPP